MEKIRIEELKESEYNPREIDKQNFKNLCESIKKHGILSPVVINTFPGRENIIIAGHQRVKAAKEVGLTEVPLIKVSLDPANEKALNLALNKISGRFEENKLIDLIEQINNENEDILKQTGFSTEEINYLLGLSDKQKEGIFARGAEDGFDASNKYGIKEGDIAVLDGKHRIICGNRLFPQTFRELLGEEKVDLIVTSPPYNLDIKYGKYSDNQQYKDYIESIKTVFSNCKEFTKKGRFFCINIGREWGPINMPAKYDQLMENLGLVFFRNIYWTKPLGSARGTITTRNPFPRYYTPKVQTEIIEIFSSEEEPRIYEQIISYKHGEPDRQKREPIPEILLSKYSGNVWEMMTETQLGEDHPAPFPVQLPFNCIRFFTFEGEKILDPYLGSGTSIIAADQLNRAGYGVEIDPSYVSLAIERFLLYKPNAKMEIIKHEILEQNERGN